MISVFIVCVFIRIAQSNEECGIWNNDNKSPWSVGLHVENNGNFKLICLGTIIKPNFILTAAQCVCENSSNIVLNNTIYITSGNYKIMVEKTNIFINKAYRGFSDTKGDIAIIKLEEALTEIPICIDWDNSIQLQDGYWLKQQIWQQQEIKMIDARYVELPLCLHTISESFVKRITNDKICAQLHIETSILDGIGKGAGLIYLNFFDNLWYIRGIATLRDVEEKMVAYTNVNIFLNWLSTISSRP